MDLHRVTPFGRYIRRFMGRWIEAARFAGLGAVWGGAWPRRPSVVELGAAWILGCWLWGFRRAASDDRAV